MADRSDIEWTDATVNYINGCSPVSKGCDNCYAARMAATRLKTHPMREGLTRKNAAGVAKFNGVIRLNEKHLEQPLHWKKPRRIFWNAHGDPFHENVPDEVVDRMFAVMALTPQHTHQVLTKRPHRARLYMQRRNPNGHHPALDYAALMAATGRHTTPAINLKNWPLTNVWMGTSVEDQWTADERIPDLLAIPAAVRFVSAEPLLGPVDFLKITKRSAFEPLGDVSCLAWIDLIIVGGESGPGARPMHPDWVRTIRDQCEEADVSFFFKQWGEFRPGAVGAVPGSLNCVAGYFINGKRYHAVILDGDLMVKTGKKASGRMLDSVLHDALPPFGLREERDGPQGPQGEQPPAGQAAPPKASAQARNGREGETP